MGNVAIAFIESTISLSSYVEIKRQKRIELKRIRSLIPRYLARLNDCDISITTLNLNGLGVDNTILRLLSCPLLSGETRVQELYLEHNWIGPEGATCIARLLSRDNHLKNVSLAHNPVGSVGMMAIASALEQNTSLERLDLSHCDIDDNGIQKLTHSLKSNSSLKYLNLEGNYISSNGVYSLIRCVYDTSSMHSLWASNHSIRAFYGQWHKIYSASLPDTLANRQLVCQLGEILATCNRRYSTPLSTARRSSAYGNASSKHVSLPYKLSNRIAACKILRHYVKEETNHMEYWETVEGMEEKLIPNVLQWLVRHGDVGVIYGVVRDMPWMLEKKVDKKTSSYNNNTVEEEAPALLVEA